MSAVVCLVVGRNGTWRRVGTTVVDPAVDFAAEDYVTYKVVAVSPAGIESAGALHTCSSAREIDKDRYIRQQKTFNGKVIAPEELD